MTLTDTRPPRSAGRSPAVRTARNLLSVQLSLGAWLWGIVVVVAVVLTVALDRFGTVEASVWEDLDQGPRWFLFAMSIVMVAGYFPAHVANGMTRRSFVVALAAVMAVVSAGYAALRVMGYAAERAVFSARGWPSGLEQEHLFAHSGRLGAVVVEELGLLAVYAASGLLVGAVYYRGGGWWGTLALPLTVGPVFAASALVTDAGLGGLLRPLAAPDGAAVGLAALLLLVVVALLVAASHAVLRSAPIRIKTG